MEKKELYTLTDEELLAEKKKMKNSKTWNAVGIGFLAGVLIFGFGAWVLSPEKRIGFLIPMIFPIAIIYRLIKSPNSYQDLEEILKERNLN